MRLRAAVIVMAALLALYLVFVIQYALRLIAADGGIAKALGVALIVLPLIASWLLVAELVFGARAARLAGVLQSEGGLPVDSLPRLPSGRPDPAAADLEFPAFQADVERDPRSWRAWFRLGLAYDASGDRRRARWATRNAIRLYRAG